MIKKNIETRHYTVANGMYWRSFCAPTNWTGVNNPTRLSCTQKTEEHSCLQYVILTPRAARVAFLIQWHFFDYFYLPNVNERVSRLDNRSLGKYLECPLYRTLGGLQKICFCLSRIKSEFLGRLSRTLIAKSTEMFWLVYVMSAIQDIMKHKAYIFFVIPFYLQSVPVHSANCVKTCIHVYSGM
jgi:hypothetical protein